MSSPVVASPTIVIAEIAYSAALFIFFWKVLAGKHVKSLLDIAQEREMKTSGSLDLAKSNERETKAVLNEIETKLRDVRVELGTQKEASLAELKSRLNREVNEKQALADLALVREQNNISAQTKAAKAEIPQQAKIVADNMLKKLMSTASNVIH